MERINLTKYGFYRTPDKDFSDDGARFTCYGLKGANHIRLSKTKWQNEIFLSATIYGSLDYDEYTNLPHYKGLDRLNGIDMSDITETDLKQLAEDCIEYQKEYEAAEKSIVYPTDIELLEKLNTIKRVRAKEYNEVAKILKENVNEFIMLDKYEICNITEYMRRLQKDANKNVYQLIETSLNTPYSRSIMKNTNDLKPSWYYRELLEKFKKFAFKGVQAA